MSNFEMSLSWMKENRCGSAKLAGLALVPSQFMSYQRDDSRIILDASKRHLHIEEIKVGRLTAIIVFPGQTESKECVLFHNPNGMTVAQFLDKKTLLYTPKMLQQHFQCPIIMYDYRGTGLNGDEEQSWVTRFRPTYQTVVDDGGLMLNFALRRFFFVHVWGSSLGGGVATVSLANQLQTIRKRVKLYNHDSFTTTARVIFPKSSVMNQLFWLVGGQLDAQSAMDKLIKAQFDVVVICHLNDPVIPAGARMAEHVERNPCPTVQIITCNRAGHAMLDSLCLSKLK